MANGLLSKEEAEAHRRAIAARFGQRILAGDAVFLGDSAAAGLMPVSISGGTQKNIGGFNSWMLRQVTQDRSWTDPRFFTAAQLREQGATLKQGAAEIALQYVSAVGGDGSASPEPLIRRVSVFNASDVDGLPVAAPVAKFPAAALTAALLEADFEIGSTPAEALADWVIVVRHEVGQGAIDANPLAAALADAMTLATVAAQIDGAQGCNARRYGQKVRELLAVDPERLANDPAAFFQAVKASELATTRTVQRVREASLQLRAAEQLAPPPIQQPETEAGKSMTNTANAAGNKRTASPRVQALFENRQAVLAVPFKEKDRASILGAVYYPPLSVWFVPADADLNKFREWDPREHALGEVASEREILEQFAKDMQAVGLEIPTKVGIQADGQWHNVPVTTKKAKNKSGAYILNLVGGSDGTPRGVINNKHTGEWLDWTFEGPLMTPEQKARLREQVHQRSAEAERVSREVREVAAVHAAEILAQGMPADRHPYVVRKGIDGEGMVQVQGDLLLQYPEFIGQTGQSAIRANEMYLMVPMTDDDGRLRAVQAINGDGSIKSFMRGAQKQGTSLVLGAPSLKALAQTPGLRAVAFTEGVATGASWRRPTGLPTVVCFDAGNLEVVAASAARLLPPDVVPVLAVDNDQFHVEQALGQLAHRLGVNPNARSGSVVEVFSGPDKSRLVGLGDALADGEWHQAPHGRYRMSLDREADSTEVRAIRLEMLVDGQQRANSMTFSNRGLEAGRTAAQSFAQARPSGAPAVLVVPEFRDLASRPTDWNDLAKLQGFGQVRQQAQKALADILQPQQAVRQAAVQRQAAGISR